ncbi:MAG: hypothetical protein V2I47_04190 [Bacteroidales bacterium]|nr:hypothetical protein [Bacteroidales bacterium]
MKVFTQITMITTLLLLFMVSGVTAQELTKNYNESFDVNADAKVQISNQYGQVNVQTWEKNQVMIEVEVSVDAKSEKESQRILDKIDIEISGDKSLVSASTAINGKLNCNNCDLNITYEVKMPSKGMLELSNTFGNAVIGDLEGGAKLNVEYGNLEAGTLSGKLNTVTVKFGSADIDEVKAADIHMEYGELELDMAGYLDLYSRFNSIEIGKVSELALDSQYDGIEIGSGDVLEIKAAFSDLKIGEVFDKIFISNSYAGIEIVRVAGGFSLVDIENLFGSIDIGVSSSASYKLEAKASFGDIDFPGKNASIIREVDKDFRQEVEAFIGGDKKSASLIKVHVENANIDIH